jgi:hypothetical protein
LTNVYWYTFPGAELDPLTFHITATNVVEQGLVLPPGIGTNTYISILVHMYELLGPSLLLGQQLSVIVSAIAILVFWKLLIVLGVEDEKYQALGITIAGLLPSVLLFGSLTLREPFELIFLIVGTTAVVISLQRHSLTWLSAGIIAFILMGLFHQILLITGIGLASLSMACYAVKYSDQNRKQLLIVMVGVILIACIGLLIITGLPALKGNNYLYVFGKGFMQSVVWYRSEVDTGSPRTAYGFDVTMESPYIFTFGIIRSWLTYNLGPLPGMLTNLSGWVLTGEALMRVLGIAVMILLMIRRTATSWFPILVFLILTIVWSVGTTNFGQALRHHTMTGWIPVVYLIVWLQSRRTSPA